MDNLDQEPYDNIEKDDRSREVFKEKEIKEQDAEITDEIVSDMKKIVTGIDFGFEEKLRNPFSDSLETAIFGLGQAYQHLILFPETQEKVKKLAEELNEIINKKSL